MALIRCKCSKFFRMHGNAFRKSMKSNLFFPHLFSILFTHRQSHCIAESRRHILRRMKQASIPCACICVSPIPHTTIPHKIYTCVHTSTAFNTNKKKRFLKRTQLRLSHVRRDAWQELWGKMCARCANFHVKMWEKWLKTDKKYPRKKCPKWPKVTWKLN